VKTIVRSKPILPARRTAAWKGERLQDADREEHDRERLRRGVVLACEQIRDEGLRDEAAAEAVEREQA
jgi:hypothetical protein